MKAKDDEYAAKEADRVFMDSVKEAVKAAGGRNEKAVIAMLNIDALKESKNQSDDIKKALEDVKKSDGYLFEQMNQSIIRLAVQAAVAVQIRERMMLLHFELLWDCRKNRK